MTKAEKITNRFDKVKDIKLKLGSILKIISKLNLPSDQKIQTHREFIFFDDFKDETKFNEAILTLNYKDNPQEVIKFGIYGNKIDIQYIQRVRNNLVKTKENRNLLLEALIFSSIHVLKRGCILTCEKIPFLKEKYEFKVNNPNQKLGYSKDHLKKELNIYNPIRDRYFTKDGVLNFKKERVLLILNNYNKARKNKPIIFPKISLLKRIKAKPKTKIHFL